jgi:CubicO group peptidase (beta-lactamase class C family)
MNKRPVFLLIAVVLLFSLAALAQVPMPVPMPIPVTGKPVPGFEEFEQRVLAAIEKDHVPGAAIAFVKDGRLVYARGFGWADEEARQPIQPTSVFRLASISKSLTGIGILKLIQNKQICMQQKVFTPRNADTASYGTDPCARPILDLQPIRCSGCKADPRIYDITVQDLMQMSGGWINGSEKKDYCGQMIAGGPDWGFAFPQTRKAMHLDRMPTRAEVIRFGISHKLSYTPGTCFCYANFNFMILGQVIEKVTGQPYEQWMQENVLHPMGATHANVLLFGRSLPNEVDYYRVLPSGANARCCVDMLRPPIDSFGGWTASIIDLAHVQASLRNGVPSPNPLTPETMSLMIERPANPKFAGKFMYWTDGWDSVWCPEQIGGADGCTMKDVSWRKGGDFTVGTITGYSSWSNGVGYVLLFNSHTATNMQDINEHIIQPMVRNRQQWPAGDLFPDYQQ